MRTTAILSLLLSLNSVAASSYGYTPTCASGLIDNTGKCCGLTQTLDHGVCCDPAATATLSTATSTIPPAPYQTTPSACVSGLYDNSGKCCSVYQTLDRGICCNPAATSMTVTATCQSSATQGTTTMTMATQSVTSAPQIASTSTLSSTSTITAQNGTALNANSGAFTLGMSGVALFLSPVVAAFF